MAGCKRRPVSGRCPVESPACPSDAAALLSNPDPGTDMNRRCLCTAIAAFFLLGTALAHAQEIDELLDGGIPGDSQVGGRLGPLARPTIPLTTPTDPTLDLPRNVVQPVLHARRLRASRTGQRTEALVQPLKAPPRAPSDRLTPPLVLTSVGPTWVTGLGTTSGFATLTSASITAVATPEAVRSTTHHPPLRASALSTAISLARYW